MADLRKEAEELLPSPGIDQSEQTGTDHGVGSGLGIWRFGHWHRTLLEKEALLVFVFAVQHKKTGATGPAIEVLFQTLTSFEHRRRRFL